jgi:hypothetical protein
MAILFMIVLASFIPIPITFYTKDKSPTFLIEMVDKKEEDDEESEIKELF